MWFVIVGRESLLSVENPDRRSAAARTQPGPRCRPRSNCQKARCDQAASQDADGDPHGSTPFLRRTGHGVPSHLVEGPSRTGAGPGPAGHPAWEDAVAASKPTSSFSGGKDLVAQAAQFLLDLALPDREVPAGAVGGDDAERVVLLRVHLVEIVHPHGAVADA
jgi:hypothetical protein